MILDTDGPGRRGGAPAGGDESLGHLIGVHIDLQLRNLQIFNIGDPADYANEAWVLSNSRDHSVLHLREEHIRIRSL